MNEDENIEKEDTIIVESAVDLDNGVDEQLERQETQVEETNCYIDSSTRAINIALLRRSSKREIWQALWTSRFNLLVLLLALSGLLCCLDCALWNFLYIVPHIVFVAVAGRCILLHLKKQGKKEDEK